jgi:hypothetical protein
MSCDLENAYLNAPCREKIWFEAGIECGEDQGKVCVVVRSLYGLKSAGAAFHFSLAQILQDIGYVSLKADPDVWLQKAVRDDGHKYYKMLFVYVDDILALSHKAEDTIKEITASTRQRTEVSNPQRFISAPMSLKCNYLTVEKFELLHPKHMSRMHLLLLNGFYKKTGMGTY